MKVFISYSSKEYDKALSLKKVLEANKIDCWMAPQSIPSGGDYIKEIPQAIKACDIFLLLLTEASQVSTWVPKELDTAINGGKIIIPFHADESALCDAFNFMLSNVQRIEAFNRLSDAYKQLVIYIKSIEGETDFSNIVINDNSAGKKNIFPISFNTLPGRDYIAAKETRIDLPYRSGPIKIDHEKSYWVLATVNNMCPDDKAIAENVRLTMAIKKLSDYESVIESVISCPNAEPKVTKHSIQFLCDVPFELEYFEKSAYMYSEYYGLHSSKKMALTDDIMTEKGSVLGFWSVDGRIPGGLHNSVTVSIQVRVVRKRVQASTNRDIKNENTKETKPGMKAAKYYSDQSNLNAGLFQGGTGYKTNSTRLSGIYLGHSGFFIESKSASMLFDWSEGALPIINKEKPLYVFISHVHNDHFNRKVFDLVEHHPHVEFFLGYDGRYPEISNYLDNLPDRVTDNLSRFNGIQKLYSDDGKMLINTLQSTDEGVAYIVRIDGKTLYHAGDLFLMQLMDKKKFVQMSTATLLGNTGTQLGSYDDYLEQSQKEFEECTEPLRGVTIDYAMLPLDSRSYAVAEGTIKRYMDIATIKSWSPMHLWGHYEFVDKYLQGHPEYADTMIGPSKLTTVMRPIGVGDRYEIL